MAKPLHVIHTNPQSGLAEILVGDRALAEQRIAGATFEQIKKTPNDSAAPHHPGTIMYLRVLEGTHTIIVPSKGGTSIELLVLDAADDVVFADLASSVKPTASTVCFTGHASQAGKNGNRFERCPLPVTIEELKLKPRGA